MLTDTVRPSGQYATYRGRAYRVIGGGTDRSGFEYVGLRLDDGDDTLGFDQVVDRLDGRRMAKVAPDQLDSYEEVTTVGRFDGAEVTLFGQGLELGAVVPCYTLAGPGWTDAHGFEGSQHDGWWGDVPVSQITDIVTTSKDLRTQPPSGDRS